MYRFKLKVLMLFIGLMIGFSSPGFAQQEAGKAVLKTAVRHGWIDVYVINEGPGDLSPDFRPDISQLGSKIRFSFYNKDGVCKSCKFKPEEDFLYRIPVSDRHGVIFPTEIAGISFPVGQISDRYGLKKGCYAFFAVFLKKEGEKRTSRTVSNVSNFCVK